MLAVIAATLLPFPVTAWEGAVPRWIQMTVLLQKAFGERVETQLTVEAVATILAPRKAMRYVLAAPIH